MANFGTDGIRAPAGSAQVCPESFVSYGGAIAQLCKQVFHCGSIWIANDGRNSAASLVAALNSGLLAHGVEVYDAGVLPTPGLAYLAKQHAAVGIMITASHNPWHDNGMKLFSPEGVKFSPQQQHDFKQALLKKQPYAAKWAKVVDKKNEARRQYLQMLTDYCKSAHLNLNGTKIVLDCANGATHYVAAELLTAIGATVVALNQQRDGCKINAECGSTSPQALQAEVLAQSADIGIAFDGDGDRLLLVDHNANIIDGDGILYLLALTADPKPKGVVTSIMSNAGLSPALEKHGIKLERGPVGDQAIRQLLLQHGWSLGGEPSGHIIILPQSQSGDGLFAVCACLDALIKSGRTLAQWHKSWERHPQKIMNLARVDGSVGESFVAEVNGLAKAQGLHLHVRHSKTEPVWRVLISAKTPQVVASFARVIEQKYQQILV